MARRHDGQCKLAPPYAMRRGGAGTDGGRPRAAVLGGWGRSSAPPRVDTSLPTRHDGDGGRETAPPVARADPSRYVLAVVDTTSGRKQLLRGRGGAGPPPPRDRPGSAPPFELGSLHNSALPPLGAAARESAVALDITAPAGERSHRAPPPPTVCVSGCLCRARVSVRTRATDAPAKGRELVVCTPSRSGNRPSGRPSNPSEPFPRCPPLRVQHAVSPRGRAAGRWGGTGGVGDTEAGELRGGMSGGRMNGPDVCQWTTGWGSSRCQHARTRTDAEKHTHRRRQSASYRQRETTPTELKTETCITATVRHPSAVGRSPPTSARSTGARVDVSPLGT